MPSPSQEFDSKQLRQVLGDFATGVTVIACNGDNRTAAMTANAFTSVSLDPPLVLISVATGARMLRHLKRNARFTINFLSGDQEDVARCYGSGRNPHDPAHWDTVDELPVIAGAASRLGCCVRARHRHGDHFLIVAEVVWISREESRPVLTFHRGQFATLAS